MAERLKYNEFESKIKEAKKPVLVDFYSDSCIPCKRMSGILAQIEEEYENQIVIYKVNTNFEKELMEKYEILSAPTFLIFKAGEISARLTGVQKKDTLVENLL